jgi:hypothetical protein
MSTSNQKFIISEINGKRVVLRRQHNQEHQQQHHPNNAQQQIVYSSSEPPVAYSQAEPIDNQTQYYPGPQQQQTYQPQVTPTFWVQPHQPVYSQEQNGFYAQQNGPVQQPFVSQQEDVRPILYPNHQHVQVRTQPFHPQANVVDPRSSNYKGKKFVPNYRNPNMESANVDAQSNKRSYSQVNHTKKPSLGLQNDKTTTSVFVCSKGTQFGTAFSASDDDGFFVESAEQAMLFLREGLNVNSQFINSATTHIKKKMSELTVELQKNDLDQPNVAGVSIVDDIFYVFSTGGALIIIFNRDGSNEQLFSDSEPHQEVAVMMRSTKVASFGIIISSAVARAIDRGLLMKTLGTGVPAETMADTIWKQCNMQPGSSIICFRF